MRNSLIAACFALANIGTAQAKAAPARTGEVQVNISSVAIPSGFDNSEPVAILSGVYPNSCYSWNRAEVHNVDETTHEVKAFADVRMGMCLMVLVPYSQEVAIGKLNRGTHTLRFVNGDGTFQEKKLVVE